jgi:hypothetical protein
MAHTSWPKAALGSASGAAPASQAAGEGNQVREAMAVPRARARRFAAKARSSCAGSSASDDASRASTAAGLRSCEHRYCHMLQGHKSAATLMLSS